MIICVIVSIIIRLLYSTRTGAGYQLSPPPFDGCPKNVYRPQEHVVNRWHTLNIYYCVLSAAIFTPVTRFGCGVIRQWCAKNRGRIISTVAVLKIIVYGARRPSSFQTFQVQSVALRRIITRRTTAVRIILPVVRVFVFFVFFFWGGDKGLNFPFVSPW